jgi:hypothetical protein
MTADLTPTRQPESGTYTGSAFTRLVLDSNRITANGQA